MTKGERVARVSCVVGSSRDIRSLELKLVVKRVNNGPATVWLDLAE